MFHVKESTCLDLNALFRVDEFGFFLYWLLDGRDAQVLDMGQVRDRLHLFIKFYTSETWHPLLIKIFIAI